MAELSHWSVFSTSVLGSEVFVNTIEDSKLLSLFFPVESQFSSSKKQLPDQHQVAGGATTGSSHTIIAASFSRPCARSAGTNWMHRRWPRSIANLTFTHKDKEQPDRPATLYVIRDGASSGTSPADQQQQHPSRASCGPRRGGGGGEGARALLLRPCPRSLRSSFACARDVSAGDGPAAAAAAAAFPVRSSFPRMAPEARRPAGDTRSTWQVDSPLFPRPSLRGPRCKVLPGTARISSLTPRPRRDVHAHDSTATTKAWWRSDAAWPVA